MRFAVGRALVTVALGGAILSPLARERGWDSFPISSYPMFSSGVTPVMTLAHVLLVQADGTRAPAPPSLVGTAEPMVATAIVRAHLARGTASELCRAIAARAGAARVDAVAVEVVSSAFDVHRYFAEEPAARAPVQRTVHARCDVVR